MKKLIKRIAETLWRGAATIYLARRASLRLSLAWEIADACAETEREWNGSVWSWDSPSDAVDEELSCWTD